MFQYEYLKDTIYCINFYESNRVVYMVIRLLDNGDACLSYISDRMNMNISKLNQNKIELIIFILQYQSNHANGQHSIIFLTFAVFGAIFLFQLPKLLLQLSLLVGLIIATLFFITLHLMIL